MFDPFAVSIVQPDSSGHHDSVLFEVVLLLPLLWAEGGLRVSDSRLQALYRAREHTVLQIAERRTDCGRAGQMAGTTVARRYRRLQTERKNQ